MEEKFTVEEFRNFILSQDSLGDVMYYLDAKNIRKANFKDDNELLGEECRYFDLAQGRSLCTCLESELIICEGPCKCFDMKLI